MDMRGYGESDKPEGRHAYVREKLVDDVRQLIQKLGKFSLQSNKKKISKNRF
jgi:pimeloyl-ACP methyl ester carboxylesterase